MDYAGIPLTPDDRVDAVKTAIPKGFKIWNAHIRNEIHGKTVLLILVREHSPFIMIFNLR